MLFAQIRVTEEGSALSSSGAFGKRDLSIGDLILHRYMKPSDEVVKIRLYIVLPVNFKALREV